MISKAHTRNICIMATTTSPGLSLSVTASRMPHTAQAEAAHQDRTMKNDSGGEEHKCHSRCINLSREIALPEKNMNFDNEEGAMEGGKRTRHNDDGTLPFHLAQRARQ